MCNFQKSDEKQDATDDEALSWKEILDSNIEATTKKKKPNGKKENDIVEDTGTSSMTISDLDDKTPSKSLVDKIKETKAVVHKENSETDEKNLVK